MIKAATSQEFAPERITIVLTTWNRKALLDRAIRSVVAQTDGRWRLLVMNNASTDGTTEYLARWASHPNIRVVNQPRNIGSRLNSIAGYEAIDSEWGTLLCDDDYLEPEFVARVLEAASGFAGTLLLVGFRGFLENGTELYRYIPVPGALSVKETIQASLEGRYSCAGGSSFIFRTPRVRHLISHIKDYPGGFFTDTLFALEFAAEGGLMGVPHLLYDRQEESPGSGTQNFGALLRWGRARKAFVRDLRAFIRQKLGEAYVREHAALIDGFGAKPWRQRLSEFKRALILLWRSRMGGSGRK